MDIVACCVHFVTIVNGVQSTVLSFSVVPLLFSSFLLVYVGQWFVEKTPDCHWLGGFSKINATGINTSVQSMH